MPLSVNYTTIISMSGLIIIGRDTVGLSNDF